MEVFTQFFRRVVSSNAPVIFSGARDFDHGSYKLLQQEMDKVSQDPEQASKISEAIDTSKDDIFRDFDLPTFIFHFYHDPLLQTLLAIAFTRCSRPDLRSKADKSLAETSLPCLRTFSEARTQLQNYHPRNISALIEYFAISPSLPSEQKIELFLIVRNRYDDQNLDPPAEVMSSLVLLQLPGEHQKLARTVAKAGPKCTMSKQAVEDVLHGIGLNNITESELVHAIVLITLSRSVTYDLNTFLSTVKAKSSNLSIEWQNVISGFDIPHLRVQTEDFLRLFRAFRPIAVDDPRCDLQSLWSGQWQDMQSQISFVHGLLNAPTEEVGPAQIPRFRSCVDSDDLDGLPAETKGYLEAQVDTQYASVDALNAVFEVLLQPENPSDERYKTEILNEVYQNHPVVFLLALPKLKPKPWSQMQEKFVYECFRQFIEKQRQDSTLVLEALYTKNPQYVFDLCALVFQQDPRQTENVYQRAEELGWTDEFLKHWSNPLALDMACMRNKLKSSFDLDKYLSDVAEGKGHSSLGMILCKYVRIKADDEYRVQREQTTPQSVPLSLATVHTLLEKLEELTDDRELVEGAHTTCLQTYPRLMNYGVGFDSILETSSEEKGNKLPEETDKQMSELFGRMYRSELSIRDMVSEMKEFKTSQNASDQDLFCCIVHGLFDEYVCYNEYPEDALEKTALLFGNIIKYKLLPSIPRDFGLVLILRAVRDHPTESLMHRFGIEALLQISDQLPEWPGLCSLLLRISTLQNPEILESAREGLNKQQGGGGVNGDGALHHTNGDGNDHLRQDFGKGFRSIRADPPPTHIRFAEPDRNTQEKILFVINNLSKDNLSSKIGEVKGSLLPEHCQWFASYLVEQRAKLEPNNQEMYFELVSMLEDKLLTSEILRETYAAIAKLMGSEATMTSTNERAHLKNLGGWLGSQTLAQDKPIKHKNIYFVDLLVEGHESQRLIVVIPFTCKVLYQGAQSVIFKPPNPWLMEIVQVLKELYDFVDLKLNTKFEIEVLFKELKLDLKKIEPATVIRDRQGEDDMTNISILPDGIEHFDELSLNGAMNRGVRERLSAADIMATLPNLADVLKYPPGSGSPQEQNMMRDIIYQAFNQAIQEIIAPVVERSITIASISTAQLISKDYALNADPEQYQLAARQMVKSLAGSLALVTCKEPLRMSITNWIRRPQDGEIDSVMPEGQIMMCVNDNLDTACSFVEQAAVDRAIPEIDHVIASEVEERRRFLAEGANRDFVSSGANVNNRWSSWLPEPYKQNVGGLNDAQRAVYEEFERRVHGTNIGHTQHASADSTGRQIPDVLQETLAMPNLSTPADQHVMPHQSPLTSQDSRLMPNLSQPRVNGLGDSMPPHERISMLIEDVQKAARVSDAERLKDLEKNSPIFQDFRQILIVLTASTRPAADLLARQVAEKICTIFATKPPEDSLEAEVLAFLLSKLCQLSELIIRDVLRWMTANEHLLMQSSNVIAALVIVGLMDFNRVDAAIALGLRNREQQSLQLLSELMDQTLFLDEPQALRADFANSLVAMAQWLKEEPGLPVAQEINQNLKVYGMPEFVTVAVTDKTKAKNDQMRYIFDEWVGMYENLQPDAAKTGAFLKDLHKGQTINGTEDLAIFLRLSIDSCIESFEREAQSMRGSIDNAFLSTDALAKLIIMMVVFQGETNGAVQRSKAPYLETILSVLVLIANHHQVMHGVGFHQRVFHRLFSIILYEYSSSKLDATSEHNEMMVAIGNTLKSLQPAWFPGFAFAWMNLIMHRVFVTGTLRPKNDAGLVVYRELIGLSLLYFCQLLLIPNIDAVLADVYRGILRNMLVLHHDYPEFLCANHAYLCSRSPNNVPQLRNLILTSRPAALMDLPDPMTPGLKVERLEEMNKSPELASDFDSVLRDAKLIDALESVLRKAPDLDASIKQIKASLTDVTESFVAPAKSIEIINTIVPYIAHQTLSTGARFDPNSPAVTFLIRFATALGYQHRLHLANALADQIRYPNTHTDFFCKFILHLWGSNNITDAQRELREPVCRVVFERLAAMKPHPWGMMVLSLEFQQNQSYGFWDVVASEGSMQGRLQQAMRPGQGGGLAGPMNH